MKIFSPPPSINSNSTPNADSAKKMSKSRKGAEAAPEKKAISNQEIKEKLANHVQTSNSAKSLSIQKSSKPLGSGFMNEEVKPKFLEKEPELVDSVKDSHLLLSDVKLNDPKDSNTQEKLKTVLKNGAFNFNPREKETLEKILADN
jgi:hypothetical protein